MKDIYNILLRNTKKDSDVKIELKHHDMIHVKYKFICKNMGPSLALVGLLENLTNQISTLCHKAYTMGNNTQLAARKVPGIIRRIQLIVQKAGKIVGNIKTIVGKVIKKGGPLALPILTLMATAMTVILAIGITLGTIVAGVIGVVYLIGKSMSNIMGKVVTKTKSISQNDKRGIVTAPRSQKQEDNMPQLTQAYTAWKTCLKKTCLNNIQSNNLTELQRGKLDFIDQNLTRHYNQINNHSNTPDEKNKQRIEYAANYLNNTVFQNIEIEIDINKSQLLSALQNLHEKYQLLLNKVNAKSPQR